MTSREVGSAAVIRGSRGRRGDPLRGRPARATPW